MRRAPPLKDEAKKRAADAEAFRASVPEEHRAYGITGCGAATGDDALVEDFLFKEQAGLCRDVATGTAGKAAYITAAFTELSAQSAATVLLE